MLGISYFDSSQTIGVGHPRDRPTRMIALLFENRTDVCIWCNMTRKIICVSW